MDNFHIAALGLLTVVALFFTNGCVERKPTGASQSHSSDQLPQSPKDATIPAPAAPEAIQLFDVTDSSGIEFVHDDGRFEKFCLPETMGGGLALFDFDGDGRIDLYFCNGAPLAPGSNAVSTGNVLYRNLGGLRFAEIAVPAGVASLAYTLGATVGDYDNDGFPDLFLSNFGRNTLFHNHGDGTFETVKVPTQGDEDDRFSAGASFADFDADGALDLFVGNYVCLTPKDIVQQSRLSRTTYPGPQDFPPESNSLFRNSNDGGWTDTSFDSKVAAIRGTAMGCVTGDFDRDGDIDVYVVNDEMPNFYFRNNGAAMFDEAAVSLGIAVNEVGNASGSMGVDAGDLNNDGRDDLFVTTFENESVNLFQMIDQGLFQEVSRQTHVGDGTLPHVTWGCSMGDFDLDGDRDLYVASGHLDLRSGDRFYRAENLVLKNLLREQHQFRFTNVTPRSGDMGAVRHCSRGAALADLDNDGDLDVVAMNLREKPTLIENRSVQPQNHWLQLKLIGTKTNRDANGTRIRILAGDLELVDEVRNGRGYQSYWGSPLHFGLGTHQQIDELEIAWWNGQRQIMRDIRSDQTLIVVQPLH